MAHCESGAGQKVILLTEDHEIKSEKVVGSKSNSFKGTGPLPLTADSQTGFLSSFFDSPVYVRWRDVGYHHGLHNDEEVACFLLKYYEDTVGIFPTGSTACTLCQTPLAVSCPTCGKGGQPSVVTNSSLGAASRQVMAMDVEEAGNQKVNFHADSGGNSHSALLALSILETAVKEEEEKEFGTAKQLSRRKPKQTWRIPPFQQQQPQQPQQQPQPQQQQQAVFAQEMFGEGGQSQGQSYPGQTSLSTRADQNEFPPPWQLPLPGQQAAMTTDSDTSCHDKLMVHFENAETRASPPSPTPRELYPLQNPGGRVVGPSDQASALTSSSAVTGQQAQQAGRGAGDRGVQLGGERSQPSPRPHQSSPSPSSSSRPSRKRGRPPLESYQPQKSLQCPHCRRLYHSRQGLIVHVKLKHFIPGDSGQQASAAGKDIAATAAAAAAKKKKPGKTSTARRKNRKSGYTTLNFECGECRFKTKTKKGLQHHIKLKHGTQFLCAVCLQRFSSRQEFSCHVETAHGKFQPVFECTVCSLTFSARSALRRHVHLKHRAGDVTHICQTCCKWFERQQDLDAHMASSHPDTKSFLCETCGGNFPSKTLLQKHKVAHQERITCHLCGKSIFHRSWDDHMRRHKGERTWHCDVCGKTFVRKDELQLHGFTHNQQWPFCCEICGMRYRQKGSLTSHLRTHTGEKPYQCPHCEACFTRPRGLRDHLRTHTGERPYECTVCHRRFSNSGNLSTHRRTVHKLGPIPRSQQSSSHNLRNIGPNVGTAAVTNPDSNAGTSVDGTDSSNVGSSNIGSSIVSGSIGGDVGSNNNSSRDIDGNAGRNVGSAGSNIVSSNISRDFGSSVSGDVDSTGSNIVRINISRDSGINISRNIVSNTSRYTDSNISSNTDSNIVGNGNSSISTNRLLYPDSVEDSLENLSSQPQPAIHQG